MIEEDVSVGQTIELCANWGAAGEDDAGDPRMTAKEEKATRETVLKLW